MRDEKGFALPILLLIFLVAVVVGVFIFNRLRGGGSIEEVAEITKKAVTGTASFNFDENTPGYENFQNLRQGCPAKDCIPSIDEPVFESVSEADTWLADDDIVFALDYQGEASTFKEVANEVRAYPQRIMNWHEIVNDEVSGDPIAITFCPLCGSSLAFDRRVDGEVFEFGVSGKLHNNDLVMYDRTTDTLWQQITGEAIVGEHFGKNLKQIPLSGMRWSDFKSEFGDAQVLSRDTGFSRDYDRYPYGGYEEDKTTLFPVEGGVDNTIHPKTIVYGVGVGESFKAYPLEKIESEGVITDQLGGGELEIKFNNSDVNATVDGEKIPATRLFWFAWKAFHPKTELY